MQEHLQKICQNLKDGLNYSFKGKEENGIWKYGKLVSENYEKTYEVTNGIPRFVNPEDETWGTEEEVSKNEDLKYWLDKDGITHKELIENIYNGRSKDDDLYNFLKPQIEEMLTVDGMIMECAAGPAGGVVPYILKHDPEAKVIMNEKSFWLLNEWRELNLKKGFKNLSFALFDLTDSPFQDNTFDMISSWFGVSNIGGETQLGLNECYRTLKPNGKMFLHEIEISDETLALLTKDKLEHMKAVVEKSDKFGIGSYNSILTMMDETLDKMLTKAGFKDITNEAINTQKPDPKDGDIPGIFHESGIELIYNLKKYTARK